MQLASKTPEGSPSPAPAEGLGGDARCYELRPGRPPLFIEPEGETLRDSAQFQSWAESVRPVLDALIVRHGGVVLRGFPTTDTADFAKLVDLFPAFAAGYTAGGTPRATIQGRVMEATRLAAPLRLPLHSEMAYMRDYPKRIAFFCRQAATVGGETTIGDMRDLINDLPASVVEKLERHGVRTTRNYAPKVEGPEQAVQSLDQVSWNAAFGTDDPAKVEALCAERGLEPLWNENGGLTLFNRTEPFVVHPETGKRLYRAALHIYSPKLIVEGASQKAVEQSRCGQTHPTGTFFGDGETLTDEEFGQLMACIDKATFSWPWRNGDIMILDNLQVWHGRNPYEGPRDVQVALLD